MISRQQIRQFVAVVETGSFTKAAEAIGVTQPSLSSGIRELEGQLGAQLFIRQRPTVRLTSAGNRLLPIARRIEREFRRAEIEAVQASSARVSTILGIIPSTPTALLQAALADSDEGSIVVRESNERALYRELLRGAIDAALTIGRDTRDSQIVVIDLWRDPYRLMLHADHPLAHRERVEAEELADEVMIARRSCELLSYTSKFFTDRGVRPQFSFKSQNDDRAMALVAAGMGLTVAPHSLAREGIVSIELAEFDQARQMVLAVRRDDMENSSRYRRTVEELADRFRAAAS